MRPVGGLFKKVPCAVGDHIEPEIEVMEKHLLKCQHPGLAVYQSQHVDRKAVLQLGQLEKLIEKHLGIDVAAHFDDDPHAAAVAFVPYVGYAVYPALLVQVGNAFNEPCLVDLVGKLAYDDAVTPFFVLLYLGPGPDIYLAPAREIGVFYARAAQYYAACGEVGAFYVLAQLLKPRVPVVDKAYDPVYDLRKVMGRDIGGHADGDAAGAVYQKLREARGHDLRLFELVVKVGSKADRFLFDVGQHLLGYF